MPRQRLFRQILNSEERSEGANLDLSALSNSPLRDHISPPKENVKTQSFYRIKRRPILETQFSNIEEVDEEEDSEILLSLLLECSSSSHEEYDFGTVEFSFPINRKCRLGGIDLGFDSLTKDKFPLTKSGFNCGLLPDNHASLWYDENEKVLVTGFVISDPDSSTVNEVRVHPQSTNSLNCYESLTNKTYNESVEMEEKIVVNSGDSVTLISADPEKTSQSEISFKLHYRTEQEGERLSFLREKAKALNEDIDKLVELSVEEERIWSRRNSTGKKTLRRSLIGILSDNLFFFLLPSFIFIGLFLVYGKENRNLQVF